MRCPIDVSRPPTVATALVVATLIASVPSQSARGDRLLLRNGGTVEGTLLREPDAQGNKDYIVRTDEGILVKLSRSAVRKVEQPDAAQREYQQRLQTLPDTADGHWQMAQWCQDHQLQSARTLHLQQVLRHDPDHEQARRALGYNKIDGRWVMADQWMRQQGYQRYRGAWRTAQQIAIMERQREWELGEKQWRRQLKTWRSWLGGRRHAEALERLRTVDDPQAVTGLAELLQDEPDERLREMYVDVLARIGGGQATGALAAAALDDPDLEVRLRAIDHLKKIGSDRVLPIFVAALAGNDNRRINRAAVALGRLEDPDAILPLIGALVTRHESIVQPPSSIRPSFGSSSDGSSGIGGLNVGGGPKKVVRHLQNKSVLDALVRLTGKNFRFSEQDWRAWYARQQTPPSINLRRDP